MGLIWPLAALIWGGAEATLYFIVPDVLLTFAVLRLGVPRALLLTSLALVGALIGGTIMYLWARTDIGAARSAVDAVPLITPQMIARVTVEIEENWLSAMVLGALSGTPYKVYAIEAGGAGIALPLFMAGSAAARLIRWLLLIGVTAMIASLMRRRGAGRFAVPLWGALWLAFYTFYVSVMPW